MKYPFRLKRDDKYKAIDYIKANGRDIDIVLCEHFFGRARQYDVIEVLSGYINSDGGFGKGIELDYLYEGSTPLATTIGLDIIRMINVRVANHITSEALVYLEKVQCHNGGWRCINMDVNSLPRAAWWDYEYEHCEIYTLNPTAEIAGYFHLLGTGIYRHYADDLLYKCYSYLRNPNNCNEMHEIICLARLARMLPTSKAFRFEQILANKLNNNLCLNTSEYKSYVFTPLQVFESPYDPLASTFSNAIEDNLDYLIDTQSSDGSWNVNYNWDRYEFEFDKQIPKIKSKITLDNLIKLKNFNRIN